MGVRVVLVVAGGGGVLIGYLRAAGRMRPSAAPASWRQGAFVAGVLAVAAGIMLPDTAFSRHVVGHLLLAVVGPTLIALGAPVAVASSVSPRVRRLVAGLRRRRLARTVTQPLVIWVLFNGSLVALYLTPLYRWSLHSTVLHEAVHGHMLITGLLFAELAVGSAPTLPSRPGFPARAAAVGFSLPVHALLGLAVLSLPRPSLQPPGVPDAMADQRAGGWLLWVAGDLIVSNLLVGVLLAWAADEERRDRVAGFALPRLGKATSMSETPLRDSDITRDEPTEDGPTEDNENLDTGGEGPRDTGDQPSEDQPTEDDENLDTGGEGPQDTGDASSEGSGGNPDLVDPVDPARASR